MNNLINSIIAEAKENEGKNYFGVNFYRGNFYITSVGAVKKISKQKAIEIIKENLKH